ncbi:MAG TPA: ketopantoate hydroxymethyltransferase [Desulfitobacterium dehalogenans]|uniref:Ketopantoate hydroxymethyltransferase n=1 Tax=Desulfitobacterium dehalogenans TaxID=36854 RepID=A0A7C6Z5S5_9FIRM|nr:ketopantoate hydroxymethyltransferase [Desulfitobacterium dehalogenans]
MISIEFLSSIAGYVDGQVAKVVLNGSYEITSFKVKEAEQGLVNMQYVVPDGVVPIVSLIELRDSSDTVISSNEVYVPITADTIITQSIRVKEG